MDLLSSLALGLQKATVLLNLGLILTGVLVGTVASAIPGIRAIHCVALMTPIAYALKLPIESVLVFLLSLYHGCIYGERVATIVASEEKEIDTATLSLSCIGAFGGGILAVAGLILMVPLFQRLQSGFGPAEYFVLIIFAFSALAIRTHRYPARTLVSICLGLMMASVGIDSTTGILRFTLNQPQLYDGIEFTTVIIGLFVVSHIFVLMESPDGKTKEIRVKTVRSRWKDLVTHRFLLLRSALGGFFVGILPACGTMVASDLSEQLETTLERRKNGRRLGRLKWLLARETATNAACGGTMLPLLSLGIPGSGTSAILLGALLLYNVTPGPQLLSQQSELIWVIIATVAIANLLLLIINLSMSRLIVSMYRIPRQVLAPLLLVLTFVACFAVNSSSFSLLLVVLIGLFSYFLKKFNYPQIPLLLGFVLGELLENNLRRALSISAGDFSILFASPTAITLWVLSIAMILVPVVQRLYSRRRQK